MDFGATRNPQGIRYSFWNFDGTNSQHTMSLEANRIIEVVVLEHEFDPATFVDWETDWNIPRDTWGEYN